MYFKYLKDAMEYAEKYRKGMKNVFRYDNEMKMFYISPI